MLPPFPRLALSLFLPLLALPAAPANYKLDSAHSSAYFFAKHLMINTVKGTFPNVSGHAVFDPNDLAASRVEAAIDAKTLNTQQEKRDAHLRSADFLDVEKFPTLTFRSKQIRKSPAGNGLEMTGDLTIHGITKSVTFAVDGPTPEVNGQFKATATTKISRKDFSLRYNKLMETGGVVVGDEIGITIEAQFTRQGGPVPDQRR